MTNISYFVEKFVKILKIYCSTLPEIRSIKSDMHLNKFGHPIVPNRKEKRIINVGQKSINIRRKTSWFLRYNRKLETILSTGSSLLAILKETV
jgi:hypothetical protein